MKYIYIILIAGILTGCITSKQRAKICATCPSKVIEKMIVKDSIYYVERDSIVILPADSSLIEMLLRCDSIGRVSIESMKQKDGKRIKTKIVFKDNVLKLTALNDSILILNKIISKYKESSLDSTYSSQATVVINKCENGWHRIYKMWFIFTVGASILFFSFMYLKR
jgi:hypothetical protein